MRHTRIVALLVLAGAAVTGHAQSWHHPLYVGNGGVWRMRVPVQIRNDMAREAAGDPVALAVGDERGEVPLTGMAAEAVRVCDASGTELLYRITGPDGRPVTEGPIPVGAQLTIPAECPAGETATCYVYADNPRAWGVPEMLAGSIGVRNGGVEHGEAGTPHGWQHDAGDDRHRATWVEENPHSGQRCLKIVVEAGAEPTWIATRQRGIHVVGGQRCRLTAWVRAQDVEGYAGWYVHVGNEDDPMITSHMAQAGDGAFDWTQVTLEFDTPEEANVASLGTVLRGTGTAWFDDVALEAIDGEVALSARAGAPERLELAEMGDGDAWFGDGRWRYRVPVRAANLSDSAREGVLVHINTASIDGRLAGRVNRESIRVAAGSEVLPGYLTPDGFVFATDLPPHTIHTVHAYFSVDPTIGPAEEGGWADLLAGDANRARNPGFEQGNDLPAEWPGGAEGQRPENADLRRVEGGLFGEHAVRVSVPRDAEPAWTGWRQGVPVEPGESYLFGAWVRTEDAADGVRIHAHYCTAEGELCETKQYTGAGPELAGTEGWTLLSGVFTMPPDCRIFELHLTMNTTGTVFHDGVLMAEATEGHVGEIEPHPSLRVEELTAWPVESVVKVFGDDPAPEQVAPLRITAARNDVEPLQIALRAPEELTGLRVEVEAAADEAGRALPEPEVAVVGYVPVDHATSYYSSQSPPWHRKFPTTPGRCDGWAGWWPDPLRPTDRLDLPARTTRAAWLSVSVPDDAPAGDYRGTVRITRDGETLLEVPYTVHVWDFALPETNHVSAIYDARAHGGQWLGEGETREEQFGKLWRLMAERRVCTHRVWPDPLFRLEDGEVVADFTEFDAAAEYYFDELGFTHSYAPGWFYCFGWGHPPGTKLGEAPYEGDYPYEDADRSELRPEYRRVYQDALRLFWEHITERGWAERFVLYISDEPWFSRREYIVDQMQALCDMIHEVSEDIPIYSSTWSYEPRWQDALDVWGVGHYGRVSEEELATIKASGDRIWWTTDGQMCIDTPFCAIERLLPHYCLKYGADAYEFWGIDWLTWDPWEYGWHSYIHQSGEPGESRWVRYPNGDGYLAYPGEPVGRDGPVTSVRLENAREGVEDYEYLYLLRDLVARSREAGVDVAEGEAALELAAHLVDMPSAGGRYSTQILPDPHAVMRVKEAAAQAIETLRDRLPAD